MTDSRNRHATTASRCDLKHDGVRHVGFYMETIEQRCAQDKQEILTAFEVNMDQAKRKKGFGGI